MYRVIFAFKVKRTQKIHDYLNHIDYRIQQVISLQQNVLPANVVTASIRILQRWKEFPARSVTQCSNVIIHFKT